MNKTCDLCGKIFRTPANLEEHKDRKTPCVDIVNPENIGHPLACIYCNKLYTNIGNKNKHVKKCKVRTGEVIPPDKNVEIQGLKEQINELSQEVKELRKLIITKNCEKIRDLGGYLYFIVELPYTDKVKIGISKNPQKRLKQLQTGNPNKLIIYHMFESEDYKLLERTMHNICKDLKIIGEWFELGYPSLHSLISGL
ncbi:hypothetical protein PV-S19_0328 [Pacmanvirus S19]|nr:hypothetical protein PV-S19_0328 [Pacmanvirus S19]